MSHSVKINGLTLPRGNTKVGKVLNISLPPPKTCDTSMPCFKKGCYAMRNCYRLYPEVRAAWDGNLERWRRHGYAAYFGSICEAIAKVKPALFRWHIGGDVPQRFEEEADKYILGVCAVARRFPNVRFLMFTKRYDAMRRNAKLIRARPNLSVVLSMWPGVDVHPSTRRAWPTVWMRTKKGPDPRIPKDAKECNGMCDKCQACWGLKAGESAVINYH